jgi:putative endonuclease
MYYVYIMASRRNGTLYIGVTNNQLSVFSSAENSKLVTENSKLVEGFTKKYGVHRLVYYEQSEDVRSAIEREKRLKAWKQSLSLRRQGVEAEID